MTSVNGDCSTSAIRTMPQRDPFSGLAAGEGIDALTDIVLCAAAAIVPIYPSKVAWRTRVDRSPLSAADEAANAVIPQGLSRLLPDVPVVSEEERARPSALEAGFPSSSTRATARASSWRGATSSRSTSRSSVRASLSSGSLRLPPSASFGALPSAAGPSVCAWLPGHRRTRLWRGAQSKRGLGRGKASLPASAAPISMRRRTPS
jgi:3'-phosphoadenosine 5'-phosphosulfate (PAPS) 3'-phosphatase